MANHFDSFILLIEDCEEDYEAFLRAMKLVGWETEIYRCGNGDQALTCLSQMKESQTAPLPGLIFLDLDLPGKDGREVLAAIKNDDILKMIPVIIFTTSHNAADVKWCYQNGANCYLQKPLELQQLKEILQSAKTFWLETAILPLVE